MDTLFVKKNIQKTERKIRSESRDIDENCIVEWLGETFDIFRRLAAEWRRQAFVYDVKGNMAIATRIDARGDSSYRKRRVLRRWLIESTSIDRWWQRNELTLVSN